jgi:hypothetical protein
MHRPSTVRRQVDLVSSQLDILPAVLSISGGRSLYAAMGRDVALDAGLVSGNPVDPDQAPFAFFAGGSNTNVIGWIQGDRIAMRWLDRDTPLFLTARPPISAANFALTEKEQFALFTMRMQHYHQYARTLEKTNRIWPEPQQVEQILREIQPLNYSFLADYSRYRETNDRHAGEDFASHMHRLLSSWVEHGSPDEGFVEQFQEFTEELQSIPPDQSDLLDLGIMHAMEALNLQKENKPQEAVRLASEARFPVPRVPG